MRQAQCFIGSWQDHKYLYRLFQAGVELKYKVSEIKAKDQITLRPIWQC